MFREEGCPVWLGGGGGLTLTPVAIIHSFARCMHSHPISFVQGCGTSRRLQEARKALDILRSTFDETIKPKLLQTRNPQQCDASSTARCDERCGRALFIG